ncbi:MAG: nucleotidyltransferase family protein [Deltaproteobacteria bacterium]|nr:nucleotidyltransferase family protein [Deltaproteobacteria bacterium]
MNRYFLKIVQPFPFREKIRINRTILLDCKKLAVEYNVLLLFYMQLKRYLKETGSDEVVKSFIQEEKQTILQVVALSLPQRALEKDVLCLLGQENIPAIVLKGSAISQDIYQNINSRTSCDIDLLIKESDVEIVDSILVNNGFIRSDPEPLPFLRYRRHHTTYLPKDSCQQIPIEIHWSFSIPGFFNFSSQQIWQQVEEHKDGTLKLSSQVNLIQLLMHHHMHAFKQLRNVIDLFWGIYVYDNKIDWSDFAENIKQIGLLGTTKNTIKQIEDLWPESSKGLRGLQILKNRTNKTLFFLPVHGLIKLEPNAGPLCIKDKIIFRLALDSWDTRIFSFMKSVLPSPKIIEELYKDDNNKGMIRNYLRFIRWRFFT